MAYEKFWIPSLQVSKVEKFQNQNSLSYKLFQCQQGFPFEILVGGQDSHPALAS